MKYLPKGKYVYGDWKKIHEQGKVMRNIFPVITETYQGMHKIRPLPESDFDRKLEENYPDFWVYPAEMVDMSNETLPPTTSSAISDAQAGNYFVQLVLWIVSKFK